MNNNINITEEDIFRFVNYGSTLTEEKRKHIELNQAEYKSRIEYYRAFQQPLTGNEEAELNKKTDKRFAEKKIIYKLVPTFVQNPQKEKALRLAAASFTPEKETDSCSFADADSKYLIRIIYNENRTLLYLFLNTPEKFQSGFEIKLYPSKNKYIITDIAKPLEIKQEFNLESINIRELQE